MKRNPFSSAVLLTLGLLALLAPACLQAQSNSCSASGIFSSCRVTCPVGQIPLCSSGFLGLSVSCTCSGGITSAQLAVDKAQEDAYAGYDKLLSAFGSPESKETARAAAAMMDAARKNDAAAYGKAAEAHEKSLNDLSDEELAQIYDYLNTKP